MHPAPTAIYTLPLHSALPIYLALGRDLLAFSRQRLAPRGLPCAHLFEGAFGLRGLALRFRDGVARARSEEHTSELQSQSNLVCRLLLDTNKTSYCQVVT